jgi:hypothetical protein
MALFDRNSGLGGLLGNLGDYGFGLPSNTGGLVADEDRDAINKRALLSGLISAGLTYAATPKNLNTGSALPYLGKAGLAGFNTSQDVVDRALNTAYRNQILSARDDKLYNVDGALVDKAGKVVYQGPAKEKERKTAVVGGVLVDANTGEKIFEAPRQPKEIKYTIQNDASGQAVYVPDTPGAQALDMQGRPTTYKPALSPDQAKRQEKLEKQQDIPNLIKEAKLLLPKATGSGLGAARDIAAATFGQSTEGAQNLASLKAIQAGLILKMPRLEGPQGVLDLKLYEAAAGDIGNPFVPAATKLKALETLEKFQDKYKNEITQNQPDAQSQQSQQTNAPQSSGFKEGAKTKSKSGKSMIFRNGQWEYE